MEHSQEELRNNLKHNLDNLVSLYFSSWNFIIFLLHYESQTWWIVQKNDVNHVSIYSKSTWTKWTQQEQKWCSSSDRHFLCFKFLCLGWTNILFLDWKMLNLCIEIVNLRDRKLSIWCLKIIPKLILKKFYHNAK